MWSMRCGRIFSFPSPVHRTSSFTLTHTLKRTYSNTTPTNISQIYEYTSPAKLDQQEFNAKRWRRFTTISPSVRKAIVEDIGWERPTEIQRKVFQLALKDRSVILSVCMICDIYLLFI